VPRPDDAHTARGNEKEDNLVKMQEENKANEEKRKGYAAAQAGRFQPRNDREAAR